MTAITFDQFKRGFDAIKESYARRHRINAAMNDDTQDFACDIGTDPAVHVLQELLEVWTRDKWDDDGPWPVDSWGEGAISIGLMSGPMTVKDHEGRVLPHLTTAEDIWAMWEQTNTGPYRGVRS